MQRSTDHGKSFSEFIKLAEGTEEHRTVNNPVMVEDKNGRIHFLYCEDYSTNGGRTMRRFSDDDGLTWSEPVDVTPFTNPDYRNAFAFGPGHGIMTGDGTLIVPVWMVPKFYEAPVKSHSPSVITTFYSKDNGETWTLGELLGTKFDVICPNETSAALTADGRVHLNIRFQGFCRAKAYSANGYSDWQDFAPDYKLPDSGCFGSIAVCDDGKHPRAMLFANCATKEGRKMVTVRASFDDGKTYPISKLIDADRGGYVEIATDNKAGLIYVLYETNWGQADYLATFDYKWLTN
jgi:sialidase-1